MTILNARQRQALARTWDDAERELAEAREEIERLRKKAGQRGARMQMMFEWMQQKNHWPWFVIHRRESGRDDATSWFDADGVPL
jgi:hypothetical protein